MTIDAARAELEAAALVLGEKFATETDATWDECQRYERAALEFYKAVTDEEIRALMREYNAGSVSYELCALALCTTPGVTKRFERVLDARDAREIVAEILNNRAKEG